MAQVAYCALFEFNLMPSDFLEKDINEKAFIIAALQFKSENEKKKQQELERKRKRR